ncbi:hypothetical protein SRHO_G00079010 [Serrasalmus rhombeus]
MVMQYCPMCLSDTLCRPALASSAVPQPAMSYYMHQVSSYQPHHPTDRLGTMAGGVAVSMVTPTHLPGMGHLQHTPPARPTYAHDITLQEVPNGPELGPNGTVTHAMFACVRVCVHWGGSCVSGTGSPSSPPGRDAGAQGCSSGRPVPKPRAPGAPAWG